MSDEERGNVDKLREDAHPNGYGAPDDRERSSLRSDFFREDAPERMGRTAGATRDEGLAGIFKLGLTALGGVAAYKFLHRTPVGLELADTIARGGRYVRRGWNKLRGMILEANLGRDPRVAEALAETRETGMSTLGSIDKIRRLKEAIDTVKRERLAGSDIMKTDLGGALRDSLTTKTATPSGYTLLTVGDILRDRSVRGLVGRQQQSLLQEGLDLGLIHHGTELGPGLFKDAAGGIKDSRWALGKSIGAFAVKVLDQIQIPVINWKMSSILTRPMQILGQHRGITAVPRQTLIPGIGRISHESAYVVNGTLWARDLTGNYNAIANNVKPIFRRDQKDLFRIAGAMYGHYQNPEFSAGFMGTIEEVTGIGPAYKTSRFVLSDLFINPIRRLARGTPAVKEKIKRKYAQAGPFERATDHMLETGGHVSREYSEVANIYGSIDEVGAGRRFWDKIRAAFGKGRYVEYRGTGPKGAIKGIEPVSPGVALPGDEAILLRREHKWNMLANWLSMRPADLMSFTTGMAYKPGAGLHGWMKNTARLYGAWYGVNLGVEAARYLDYQVEDITGFSPMKGLASAYVGLRLFQKAAADTLGITEAAQYAEDLMPLSMTSTAAGMSRAVLPWLLGGVVGGKKGLAIGGAISGLLGGPAQIFYPEDIVKTVDQYHEEVKGERKVPVRANRWWEFNAEEFSGGRIKYFKPHWYAEMMSDYQYTDTVYGSKANYWRKVSNLPTPSNLFGLRKYSDRGWMGEVHAQDRPYPVVPGQSEVARNSLVAGVSATALGVATDPNDMRSKLSKVWESGTEFLGLYKFLGESILGIQAPFKHQSTLASSEEMTSLHHAFWESDMGGLLGMTELARRFLLPRNALPESYNPLPNLMPSWLPGDRAVFNADQRYFINFHRGDPYRAVPHGEYRLPGHGYETLHRMHSGQPGVYDAMDRYLILADVAPNSMAFRHYRTIVSSWEKAGVLDKSWAYKYQMTEAEVSAKAEGGRYQERRFTSKDRTIQSINESLKYNGFERAIGSAWEYATHDIIGAIPLVGTKLLKARTPYQAYMEEQVYGETFKNWSDPYGSFLAPHFRQAIADDPVSGAGRGSMAMYIGANPFARAVLGIAGAAIGGIGSSARAATTGQWEGGWTPESKQTEWDRIEYMDRLEYVRAKRLQGIAQMEGDAASALYWKNESDRTMTGLPANASIGQMQAAMPPHLKKYFRGLIGAAPEMRDKIMATIPQVIRPAFSKMWAAETSGASPEDIAADYFSRHELPADDWSGWHPNVPFSVSKIKMVDTAEGSPSTRLHHYGLWEQEMANHHLIYREMEAPSMDVLPVLSMDNEDGDRLRAELKAINGASFTSRPRFGYNGNHSMRITFNQMRRTNEFTDDFIRRF